MAGKRATVRRRTRKPSDARASRSRNHPPRPGRQARGAPARSGRAAPFGPQVSATGQFRRASGRPSNRPYRPAGQILVVSPRRRQCLAHPSRHVGAAFHPTGAGPRSRAARPRHRSYRQRRGGHVLRSATIRLDGPGGRIGARRPPEARAIGPGAVGQPVQRTHAVGPACRQGDADQGRPARPAGGRRPRQHLRLRGVVARASVAAPARAERFRQAGGASGTGDPGGIVGGDRGRWVQLARLCSGGWRARLFPACFLGVRPGRRALPDRGLCRHDRTHRAVRPVDVLLSDLSALNGGG